MASGFLKSLFHSKSNTRDSRHEAIGDLSSSEVAEISSREFIYGLIQAYDGIRNDMMAAYFQQGNRQAMSIAIMLHELASPVFYAWEYFGYGGMGDFWKEDLAINEFNRFKSSNVLEELRSSYNRMTIVFPLSSIDRDGKLKKCTMALMKVLIGKLERE